MSVRHLTSGMVALLAAVLGAALVLAACAGQPPQPSKPDTVVIASLRFNPRTVTVSKGATVTWTNKDATAHTVTSDDFPDPTSTSTPPPGSFTSKVLNPGDSFSHTFDKAGRFGYHCQIHGYLTGTVVVK
jgi:plastocyanin